MKKLNYLISACFVLFLLLGTYSCSSNEDSLDSELEQNEEENDDDTAVVVAKNTVKTSENETTLEYFTFVNGPQGLSIAGFEKQPASVLETDTGDGVLFYFREIPKTNTTLTHFGGFDYGDGQFYLNNVEVNNKKWYSPFVGDKPTGDLKITVENGVAIFTAVDIELSDNYVAPITETKKVSFSVSIDVSYFDQTNTGFAPLSK